MAKDIVLKRPDKPKVISLQDFKSLYYQLNAKPDSSIKLFKERKVIEIADLIDIDSKIKEKLLNHRLAGSFTSIKISFSDKRILDICDWNEFLKLRWDEATSIEHIELQWDFNVIIPRYRLPQRHTLKLRIGSNLKPNEMIQLIFLEDSDIKEDELKSVVICKVDYINVVISTELLSIVTDWYDALPSLTESNKLLNFIYHHHNTLGSFLNVLFDIGGVLVGLGIIQIILKYHIFQPSVNLLLNVAIALALLWIPVYIFSFIGTIFTEKFRNSINKISTPSMFNITKGDKNKNIRRKKENDNLLFQLISQIVTTIIVDAGIAIFNLLIKN